MVKDVRRTIVIVADGLGVGAAPDAASFGDEGSNTLGHIAEHVGGLKLPNLEKLGLGYLGDFSGIKKVGEPLGVVGRLAEMSAGKDTTTGHWEIAGLVTERAYPTFSEGFPEDLVSRFVKEAGIPGVLGNCAASGTVIIEELGEEHLKTLKPILYTSADSVFQLAAHEKVFGLERLYKICEIAREITRPLQLGRVIARPFVGNKKEKFRRTENRRDYSLSPPTNLLDVLEEGGVPTYGVGKIEDIFDHRGIKESNHTGNNPDGLAATLDFMKKHRDTKSLIFSNLVDFDMLYGHRRDPKGYAKALIEFDQYLPNILNEMTERDCLVITGDHGCDPTFRGTDHTREYVPLLSYVKGMKGKSVGDRGTFGDISATLAEGYEISKSKFPPIGTSFLCEFKT